MNYSIKGSILGQYNVELQLNEGRSKASICKCFLIVIKFIFNSFSKYSLVIFHSYCIQVVSFESGTCHGEIKSTSAQRWQLAPTAAMQIYLQGQQKNYEVMMHHHSTRYDKCPFTSALHPSSIYLALHLG